MEYKRVVEKSSTNDLIKSALSCKDTSIKPAFKNSTVLNLSPIVNENYENLDHPNSIDGCVNVPKESKVFEIQQSKRNHYIAKFNSNYALQKSMISTLSEKQSVDKTLNQNLPIILSSTSRLPKVLNKPLAKSLDNFNFMLQLDNPKDLKVIGGIVMNCKRLLNNSCTSNISKVCSSDSAKKIKLNSLDSKDGIDNRTDKKVTNSKKFLEDEVKSLLQRKSSHADEAESEWFSAYSKRMEKLAAREQILLKESQIQEETIRGMQCIECAIVTDVARELCIQRGHSVKPAITVKRYFECGKCHHRAFTLGKSALTFPDYSCSICNGRIWQTCGKRSLGKSEPLVPNIFLTATDWTSQKDVDKIRSSAGVLKK